jgi:hypothetical protein
MESEAVESAGDILGRGCIVARNCMTDPEPPARMPTVSIFWD